MTGEAPDLLKAYRLRWNAFLQLYVAKREIPHSHQMVGYGPTPQAAIKDMH